MLKTYAVFGAGLSAQAARRLVYSQGFAVVLFDEAGRGDRTAFEEEDLWQFEGFIFSPGFAAEHPWRRLAQGSGLPCMSEIAFAARYWQGCVIGVTGTNGKTTLTSLIDKALRQSGKVSMAAGNIGFPFSDAVLSASNRPEAYAVLEISSFQAELPDGLELDALVWSNFAEDHLDRYASIADYFSAKARLLDCLKVGSVCVVGSQVTEWIVKYRKDLDAFTTVDERAPASFELKGDSVFIRYPNSANFALAAELWRLLGNVPEPLLEAANEFALAAHRLSMVAEFGGVRFWNDSKATNFHATLAALKSVSGPIVWIGGGRAKGGDVEGFAKTVVGQVDAAVLYGEVAPRLARGVTGSPVPLRACDRLEDAVLAAAQLAEGIPLANVLLSPGFSSFDQFSSYEARGKSFLDTVLSLKKASKLR